MSEAAPQAASGPTAAEIRQGVETLELLWGNGVYLFGYDAELHWWVRKEGVTGWLLTADTLEELGQQLNDVEGIGP
jgi:hypothetical protein